MSRRPRSSRPPTVRINDQALASLPGETILETALREGVPLPNRCQVGTCGACRCRIVDGEVRELSESAYLLSGDELDQRHVLACQCVPRSDVAVAVELATSFSGGAAARDCRERTGSRPASGPPPRSAASPRGRISMRLPRSEPGGSGGAVPPAQKVAPTALALLHYLKYFLFHAIGAAAVFGLVSGADVVVTMLVTIVGFYILGDAVLGDDASTPAFRHPGVLTVQLWLALPLLALIVFASVWSVCPGDPLGFGAWVSGWSGRDVLAARAATTAGQHLAAWVVTGLMIGMIGTIPAHELTHRTWDRRSLAIGRWLLAFSFDTAFALEHVYGHHRYVALPEDPATAWNTNRRVSSWSLFNLTRHSHHHAQGEAPYHDLRPIPDAPLMMNGYLSTLIVALVPPLWHALMAPRLRAWDRAHATEGERALAARANAASGLRALAEAT